MRQAVSRTQIWVRARMPGYGLNYTPRSSAIHRFRESPRGPLYLSKRTTNARIWHKAVFKVSPSQGRSPHASGKAKNTFGPVGISLFWAPQAPGNKPNPPEGGISLVGWLPEAGGNLQCRGPPGRTAQRLDGLPNATQELERKGHTQTP